MIFKSRAKDSPSQIPQDDLEDPLTPYEQQILSKFEENDREIDQLLDQVLHQMEKLNL